jgi:hypothetical protein
MHESKLAIIFEKVRKLSKTYAVELIKVAMAHPAASNGACSRHRFKFRKRRQ